MSDLHLPIDRSNNFLLSQFGGYISLFVVVIRFVVDKMCGGVRQPRFISPQVESSGRLNERIKFSLVDALHKLRFRCPPSFVPATPVSVYRLVFHRFHTLLYVRISHYYFDPTIQRWHEILTCTIYIKIIDKRLGTQTWELYLKI